MTEKGIRSTYSLCPFMIKACDDNGMISAASGFFFEFEDEWFLVTNWHVVSGKNFLTKEPLNRQSGRFPTFAKVMMLSYVHRLDGLPGQRLVTTVAKPVEIYKNCQPLWFEHPELGSDCDVIALPMKRPKICPESMHNAANKISTTRIPIEPGGVIFIVGFPMFISVYVGLPIWKSGCIASEPCYDIKLGGVLSDIGGIRGGRRLPAFFIDSLTREGMSGSPVFAKYSGMWNNNAPYTGTVWSNTVMGSGTEFVGCYSGRINSRREEDAALGLCWRKDVIEAICRGKMRGRHPHIQSLTS